MNVKIFNSRRTILFLSHQSDSKNKNFFANSLPSLLKIHTHTNIQANYGETGSLVILNTESIYPRSLQFGRNVHRFSFSPSKKKLIAKGQIKRVSTRKEMERNGGKEERKERRRISLSLSLRRETQEEDGVRVEISSLLLPPPPSLPGLPPLLLERY